MSAGFTPIAGGSMTRILTPIITLGLFCVLASYSFGRYSPTHHTGQDIGYSQHDRDGLSRLIESSPGKSVYVWRTRKAAQIAEVWNLTPESIDSAVDILGRRK